MSLGSTLLWTNGASPKKQWCDEAGTRCREARESPGFIRGEDVKESILKTFPMILAANCYVGDWVVENLKTSGCTAVDARIFQRLYHRIETPRVKEIIQTVLAEFVGKSISPKITEDITEALYMALEDEQIESEEI